MTVGHVAFENIELDTHPSIASHQTRRPSASKRKLKLQQDIHLDHTYADSPRTIKQKLKRTTNLLIRERKEIKVLKQKLKRLSTRFNRLMDILHKLGKKKCECQASRSARI